ncbi:MAG: ABC transporter ATP-binding protein [Gaiellales bacterium]
MAELRCTSLAKSYRARAVLRDVDLVVRQGTLTAILGASGSGKTTLLRLIIGFIAPDHGTIEVDGSVVATAGGLHVAPDKRDMGYVAQEGALFPHLTVAENVAFGLSRSERKNGLRTTEALDLVGLGSGYAARRPHELSGGEQRRVGLARALAPKPRIVLLDEPFSGLDAHLRAETREAVTSALAAEGATAVLVTHDQAEALSMGHEVAVLRSGRLAQTATPTVLYRAPVDLDVAQFVGDAVILPGTARSGVVECALGRLCTSNLTVAGRVEVMIRPEQIRLVRAVDNASRGADSVSADVIGHHYYGPDSHVQLRLRDDDRMPISARTFDVDVPDAGDVVGVVVSGPVAVYPVRSSEPAA